MTIQLDTEPETGRIVVHFVLPAAEHPDPVSVVGNFNEWTPGTDLLIDHGDGTIGVNVPVEPGTVLHFRYLGSNHRWFDDPDAEQVTADGGVYHVPTGLAAHTEDEAASDAEDGAAAPVVPAVDSEPSESAATAPAELAEAAKGGRHQSKGRKR